MELKKELVTIAVPATNEISAPTMANNTVSFTVFKSEKDNIPQAGKRTWTEFAKRIQKPSGFRSSATSASSREK